MSMSTSMKRTAPLSILCCGVENGGVFPFTSTVQGFPQKREEELDGCTELESRKNSLCFGELEKETHEILRQFYSSHIGLSVESKWLNKKTHPALPSLKKVVEKLLCNHRIAYNGMVQRLFVQPNGLDNVNTILSAVFSDGVKNWGRIASVLALGAVVCERLKQENVEDCVDIVSSKISSFISTELQQFFIDNNSWDGFVEFFHIEDPESSIRNTLIAVAGLGIGACLFTLMR